MEIQVINNRKYAVMFLESKQRIVYLDIELEAKELNVREEDFMSILEQRQTYQSNIKGYERVK